jgi:hypothetical protein
VDLFGGEARMIGVSREGMLLLTVFKGEGDRWDESDGSG